MLAAQLQVGLVQYASGQSAGERQLRLKVSSIEGTPVGDQVSIVLPYVLATCVLLTLLIACANVAILMIAQWTSREHEIAIRASLGASRGRIVRALLTESLLLATAGGALGVCVTLALRGVLVYRGGVDVGFFNLAIDPRVLLQSALITVLTGIVAGIAPMFGGIRVVWPGPAGYRDKALYTRFWQIIEHYRIAAMSAVPTVYGTLAQVPVDADIAALRVPIVGASPLPATVREDFAAHTGRRLLEGYGLTEATCATTWTRPGEERPGSVGRVLPGQQIKAVTIGADGSWTDCGPGETGVLVIGGPAVFAGYVTDPALRGPRVSRDGIVRDGWLDTGDLGQVDDGGFVYLTGRAKDLIIRGGHNIDPRVIEDALLAHPSVRAAAAVGRPDRHSGEVPVAYVVPAGPGPFDETELLAWAGTAIGEAAARPGPSASTRSTPSRSPRSASPSSPRWPPTPPSAS